MTKLTKMIKNMYLQYPLKYLTGYEKNLLNSHPFTKFCKKSIRNSMSKNLFGENWNFPIWTFGRQTTPLIRATKTIWQVRIDFFLCKVQVFSEDHKNLTEFPNRILCSTCWFSVGICKYKPGYKSHDLM